MRRLLAVRTLQHTQARAQLLLANADAAAAQAAVQAEGAQAQSIAAERDRSLLAANQDSWLLCSAEAELSALRQGQNVARRAHAVTAASTAREHEAHARREHKAMEVRSEALDTAAERTRQMREQLLLDEAAGTLWLRRAATTARDTAAA